MRWFLKSVLICVSLVACTSTVATNTNPTKTEIVPVATPSLVYDIEASPYSVPLDSVVRIRCGRNVGTAQVVNGNMLITASHVVGKEVLCELNDGTTAILTYNKVEQDFAIFTADTKSRYRIPISCAGFVTGSQYMMIGYAGGTDFVVQIVRATAAFEERKDYRSGSEFRHVRKLVEMSAIPGMSGGPILDMQGHMVGTTLAKSSASSSRDAFSRELKETILCQQEKTP